MEAASVKKLFVLVLVVLLAVVVATASADNKSGLFSYTLKGNGTAVITGFDWAANGNNDVYVPRLIDGYTVTEIGALAFSSEEAGYHIIEDSYKNKFSSLGQPVVIVLPDTISVISEKAFFCTKIMACNIPASVQLIGPGAFAGCTNLTQHSVDANNETYATIDGVLYNKPQKMLVSAPAGVSFGFRENHFVVPNGIKKIGDYAFYGMNLSSWKEGDSCIGIDISSTVETIGKYAFAYIDAETSRTSGYSGYTINLANVKEIDDYAFYRAATFGYQWKNSKIETLGKYSFAYTTLSTADEGDGSFPSTLKHIDEGTFYNAQFSSLYSDLDFSQTTIDTIPVYAFSYLNATGFAIPSNIKLPMSVKKIEEYAFQNSNLKSIHIPSAVEVIANHAFSNSSIGVLSFSNDSELKSIGNNAFDMVEFSMDEIVLPNKIEQIGNRAFFAKGIKTLVIPDSVFSIGEEVCNRSITKLKVEKNSFAALYASENGFPTEGNEDTSWLSN